MSNVDQTLLIFESLNDTEYENDTADIGFLSTIQIIFNSASAYINPQKKYKLKYKNLLIREFDFSEPVNRILISLSYRDG